MSRQKPRLRRHCNPPRGCTTPLSTAHSLNGCYRKIQTEIRPETPPGLSLNLSSVSDEEDDEKKKEMRYDCQPEKPS